MAVSGMPTAAITENYAALKILKKADLSAAIGDNVSGSIEYYLNTYVLTNLEQLAADIFGTYVFTNDGVASLGTALVDSLATLSQNEVVTGNWSFSGTVALAQALTSTSTLSAANQPRVKAYRSVSNQSILDSTATNVSFTAESYDTSSMHDTGSNQSRITIVLSGLYSFNCQVAFAASNVGRREIYLLKNGSIVARRKEFGPIAVQETVLSLAYQDQAALNDYYEVQAFQTSGGALDVVLGEFETNFAAMKVW